MMFARRQVANRVADAMRIDNVDQAFDHAQRLVREMGQAVAERIGTEFRAGRIGKQGVQQRVRFALEQLRALPADTVPTVMCERLEQTLRQTIIDGLKAAGIPVTGLPA